MGQQTKSALSRPRPEHIGRSAGRKPEALLGSPGTEQDRVLSLQYLAGNYAVTGLLQSNNPAHSACDGRPMPDESRSRLERAFNANLTGVRVETNSARVRNSGALALTHGDSISFAPGAFAPNSAAGFYLLAHETAHVVQQATASVVELRANSASAEREAWRAADAVAAGAYPSIAGGQVVPSIQAADGISPLAPRPFAVEMEWTPGASSTSELGFRRDDEQFWKRYAQEYGDHISPGNRARIGGKPFQAPRVDKTWIKYYPQDALYEGDVLEHHHAGQSSRAVGVPRRLHDAYTSMHPQKTVLAEPDGPPPKPLGPLPTQERTDKEIARHTKAGRIKTASGQPPQAPIVPSTSELMSLPEGQRRPIDTTATVTIGEQIYPGERASHESRYPQPKYTPPPITGEPKPNPSLMPLMPAQEDDWSDVHPGTGPSPLGNLLDKAPKRGGKTIQLGKALPNVPSSTSAPQHPKTPATPPSKAQIPSLIDAATQKEETIEKTTAPKDPRQGSNPFVSAARKDKSAIVKDIPREEKGFVRQAPMKDTRFARALEPEVTVTETPLLKGMGLKDGRSVVKGTIINVGIGIAGALLTSWMHDKILESVNNMPKPEINQVRLWKANGMKGRGALDLLCSDLPGMASDLEMGRGQLTMQMLNFWNQLNSASQSERQRLLESATDAIREDTAVLLKAQQNVREALALEPSIRESVQAASDLHTYISVPQVWGELVKYLGLDQVEQIRSNLSWYQAGLTRMVLQPLHFLDKRLQESIDQNDVIVAQLRKARRRGGI